MEVVRGPDWTTDPKKINQDGGEGTVGLIVAFTNMSGEIVAINPGLKSQLENGKRLPPKVAVVKWSANSKTAFYAIGRNEKHELALSMEERRDAMK
jgi:hypothetical protein